MYSTRLRCTAKLKKNKNEITKMGFVQYMNPNTFTLSKYIRHIINNIINNAGQGYEFV